MSLLNKFCLTLSRFLLSAWVGAAALFVIISVRELRIESFDSTAKDILVLTRFPPYYLFGFGLVGISLVAILFAGKKCFPLRWWISVVLLALVLIVMTVDYFAIYLPLADMIDPPGSVRPAEFSEYHNYSRRFNEVHVTLSFVVAFILCSLNVQKVTKSK